MKWPICGPKLSLCCTIISVWGIIQFILLGIFFFVEAAPLLVELNFDYKNSSDPHGFSDQLKTSYHQRAYNCWIAAVLYIALLVFSGYQFRVHLTKSATSNVPTSVTSPFSGVTTEGNGYNSQYGIQFTGDQSDT